MMEHPWKFKETSEHKPYWQIHACQFGNYIFFSLHKHEKALQQRYQQKYTPVKAV